MAFGIILIFVGIGVSLLGAVIVALGGSATPQAQATAVVSAPAVPASAPTTVIPAVQAVPADVSTKSPPKVAYTERDIREMLDALTDAQKLVNELIEPSFFQLESLVVNWQGAIPNMGPQGFARALTEKREIIQTEVWPRIDDFVYKKNVRYKEQMRFALALDEDAARGEVIRALDVAIASVKLIPPNAPPETYKLVERDFQAVAKLFNPPVYRWIGAAHTRIEKMTDNLRSTGETGFENQFLASSLSR